MIIPLFTRALLLSLFVSVLSSDLICMKPGSKTPAFLVEFIGDVSDESSMHCDESDSDDSSDSDDISDSDDDQENEIVDHSSPLLKKVYATSVCYAHRGADENRENVLRQLNFFVGTAGSQVFNNVIKTLDYIRKFNFYAFKRNDPKLEHLHEEMIKILKIEARCGLNAFIYIKEWHADNLTMNWYDTERFYADRSVRVDLKVKLFEALEYLDRVVCHFHCKTIVGTDGVNPVEKIRSLISSTRDHVARRICART